MGFNLDNPFALAEKRIDGMTFTVSRFIYNAETGEKITSDFKRYNSFSEAISEFNRCKCIDYIAFDARKDFSTSEHNHYFKDETSYSYELKIWEKCNKRIISCGIDGVRNMSRELFCFNESDEMIQQ